MKFSSLRAFALAALITAGVSPLRQSHAAILTAFQFTGYAGTGGTAGNTNGASAASSTDANVTSTAYTANGAAFVTFGGGTAGNYAFDSAGNTSGGTGTDRAFGTQSSSAPASEAASVTANTYFSFTLTPAAGYSLSLTSLTFDLRTRINTGGVSPYTDSFVLRTSLDSFGTDIGGTVSGTQTGVGGNTGYVNKSFDLSALGTLAANTPITFRLYPFDTQSVSADDFTVDNVNVNGIAAVPEPATATLSLAAAALFVLRRRFVGA